jgi:glucose-1-phosphate thymidylyltransferase
MKGIVLAGGSGSRLRPLTNIVSKQLLPIYDKPLIFYPLSTLMLAGIREIAIITSPEDSDQFKKILGDGERFGASFTYLKQEKPEGLAQAFIIAEGHIGNSSCVLILGDNIFHGAGLGRDLSQINLLEGGLIFATKVSDPSQYGVVRLNEKNEPVEIVEKPKDFISDLAIPGIYFFDSSVVETAKKIVPSDRGELEITSVINSYLDRGKLSVKVISRGTAWFDAGSFDGLHDANTYVRLVQERQNLQIANLVEVAWRNGWISDEDLKCEILISTTRDSEYLKRLKNE